MELDKVVMGETTLVGTNLGECQGLEDLQLQLCQSTADSSSDDFESDKEAMICIESDSEVEWEKAEEKGFEGIRCLMESQLGEVEEHSLNVQEGVDKIRGGPEQILVEGQWTGRAEVSDGVMRGISSEEDRPQIKVGKMSLSLRQIKEATRSLDLPVLQNEVKKGYKGDQSKIGKSSIRRKGGARELRNLECSIDFDKGCKASGLRNNT